MARYILVLYIIFISISCAIKKPKAFTLLYDGKYTGIDTLILVDGCYYNLDTHIGIMFYRDGMSISSYIKDNLSISDSYNKGKGWDTHNGKSTTIYGRYIVKKDTIINQHIYYDFYRGSLTSEEKYKIISKDKILRIKDKNETRDSLENNLYEFIPLENRMDSTTWLFKKKWFYKK